MPPTPPDISSPLDCGDIRCTAKELQFTQDRRVYREIPIANIRRVVLKHGLVARHPILQLAFGVMLALLGLFGIAIVSSNGLRIGGGLVIFGFLGVWLLVDTLRSGWYLVVEFGTHQDRCAFSSGTTPEQIAEFLVIARDQFGLPVESN